MLHNFIFLFFSNFEGFYWYWRFLHDKDYFELHRIEIWIFRDKENNWEMHFIGVWMSFGIDWK